MKNKKCTARRALSPASITLAMLPFFTGVAVATEGGGSVYPSGVNTVLSGKLPPPGLTNFVYVSDYKATKTIGNNGSEKPNIHNFDLDVKALALRFDYTYSDYSILGATLSSRFIIPLVKGNVSFDVDTPAGRVHRSDRQEGVGDITLVPLLLGWSSPGLSQVVAVDIFTPTGSYDKDRLFNPGRNYWSFAPWYGITAYPIKNLEVSAKALYIVNKENSATKYKSGNELNIDYNIGYNITPTLQLGVSGYFYKQITGDDQDIVTTSTEDNKGRAFAIGPAMKYQTPAWGFVAKWQHESMVLNRAEGDKFWLQAVFRF
ncbi:SphA family protein [Pseudomonas moorei]|uniref:Uncharacterized conserved protein n=1 Tax=Pseudomonas moorei TaxID=395599 RepID=A0A1H1IDN0_9PSED|nr:transporter [Pseudomonas moorei]KAB0508999.1 phenol degradation protein meta [Pseudomonas moorei]SDR35478.1 Uncharacterized conserved protein [Pseudomonas moorei]